MSSKPIQPNARSPGFDPGPFFREELPLIVRQAAIYLGVSVQTVYLWVEQRQIPHLRVMGRNTRFLRADLVRFRATFKQEVGDGKTERTRRDRLSTIQQQSSWDALFRSKWEAHPGINLHRGLARGESETPGTAQRQRQSNS